MDVTTLRRAAVAALAATLLLAVPAAADPFLEPDEVPVDSLADLELDLAHGCFAGADGHGHGDESDEEPTLEVAVEIPDEVETVLPADADGWELDVEEDEDGRVEVVTWTAEEGTEEAAPVFGLEAVVRGEVGDVVHWPVFQGCAEASYRWIATEEDDEGDPAPSVTLVEADRDAPPPPPDEVDEPEAPDEPADDADDDPTEDEQAPDDGEPAEDEEPAGEDIDEATEQTGVPGWAVVVLLVVVVVVVGTVLAVRSRRGGATDAGAEV